jgi:hypothetical protein
MLSKNLDAFSQAIRKKEQLLKLRKNLKGVLSSNIINYGGSPEQSGSMINLQLKRMQQCKEFGMSDNCAKELIQIQRLRKLNRQHFEQSILREGLLKALKQKASYRLENRYPSMAESSMVVNRIHAEVATITDYYRADVRKKKNYMVLLPAVRGSECRKQPANASVCKLDTLRLSYRS